jgi:hypothetical protein
MGEERVPFRVLVGKLERKRSLGRLRHRWVDNIRMDLQEVGCGWVYGLDWAGPGYGLVVEACDCGNEPSGSIKCWEFLD